MTDPQVATKPPEVRISPDFRLVAIRNEPTGWSQWRVSNGGYYSDEHVADWLPMALVYVGDAETTEVALREVEAGLRAAESAVLHLRMVVDGLRSLCTIAATEASR